MPEFAERLELSATQANLIGNFGNIGMYAMGIPGGILIDKKGPRWGVLVGVVGLACGYFPMHAAYVQGAGGMGVPLLCLFALCSGIASCTAFSAALKVSATNWPRHRGTATAFPLSAFGLSAFFYTTLAAAVFPNDTGGYLLLLAIVATGMVFVGMLFLRMMPPASPYEALPGDERPGLARKDSNRLRHTSAHSRENSKSSVRGELGNSDETASLVSSDSGPGDVEEGKSYAHHHHHKPEITGWALLRTPAFWKLFVMLGLLCGVGLMTINNIGNNARSLWHHYDDSASHAFIQQRQVMHVGIISIFSFFGRLSSGIGSDWLIHHGASRFWTLVASASIFTVAQMLGLRIEDPNYLFWLSGLTGLGYGALFGVYPALVADAFGPTGMGINWGAMTWAPVLSGNFFNLAYGSILDKHSVIRDGQKGHHPERVCEDGLSCYASAYWITLIASVVGVVWALYCIRHEKAERLKEARETREHEG